MSRKPIVYFLIFLFSALHLSGANPKFTLSGKVIDDKTQEPLAYASVRVADMELWGITADNGDFTIINIPGGKITLEIYILGYVTGSFPLDIKKDIKSETFHLKVSRR